LGGEAILIYFEPIGQTLLSQGKPREAVQSYRDSIALHPKEAVHHLQLAEFLLAAGLGESARAEAKTAVKLEPNSALAEKTLADILEYDVVGRKLRPGSDYARAEAALRAAEQLDHDDRTTIGNLAILLEYNQWGLRYGPGAKLEDAVAEYRKLTAEQLAELGLRNNLAFALFYAGDFSGAQKDALSLSPQPTALIVACEAVLHGSQAALAEGRQRTAGEEQFKSVAQAAGWMLANLRKYVLAADLLEAGASGANASETAAAASIVRQTQPHEQVLFRDDAAGAAMRFELLTDDPDMTLDQLRAIGSRNGTSAFATQAVLEQIVKEERALVSHEARNGQFRSVGLDTLVPMAQPKVQGNDETGYKVTLWASQSYKSSVYIVKEDNHYKVLATSRYPQAIGLEALDRLAANDSAGARLLLDWLREDIHLAGGDDPVSDAPFPRSWVKGRNADPAAISLAAALILVGAESTAARGVSILEAAKTSATSDSLRLNLASGLCYGYSRLRQYEKAVDYSSELAKEYPESKWAFGKYSYDLRAVRRFDEAERIAEERLQHLPGDIDAIRALVASAIARRDYAKIPALSQSILAEGNVSASDLNEVAWSSLFTGRVDQSDIEAALKAANSGKKNAGILHTLGCVYAEAGKTKEARDVLLEAMDLLDLDEPDSNYWFGFGRIAEQYGERDVAIADYTRAIKPENPADIPDSSYRLAQIRLEALRNQK
jgi:tetratricopeptide (TPR) repeat protein